MSLSPIRKLALASALPLALAFSAVLSAPAMAADSTASQVYSAARSGHVDDALTQMQQVLKDHPNSAKAHFVEAELLAKAQRYPEARTELAKAEQLAPGLPFVSQHAVTGLKAQLATTTTTTPARPAPVQRESSGFHWFPVILVAGLVFLVLAFMRRRSAAANAYPAAPANSGYGGTYGNTGPQGGPWGAGGYPGGGPGYGAPGYGAPPQSGGSGIMGALAGGAAAGAGFAAGEAVIDRVFGDHDRDKTTPAAAPTPTPTQNTNQDMGGDDFGISDSGSWDDGGSSGGNDDW